MDLAAALDMLGAEDRALALDAERAFESLTAGEGVEQITQIGLQEYLWYRLPEKYLTDDADKRRVATALGRLLERMDLPRYAAICTSEQTRTVLAAYENDDYVRGRAALTSAMAASGVGPVDVPELAWGAVMGMDEAAAHYTVADALELAIVGGEFTPGARGWRQRQRAVVRQQLLRSRDHLDGASLLDRIHDERIDNWLNRSGGRRSEILRPLLPRLRGPSTLPDDLDPHVAPARWLLERAAEGLMLTQTQRLRPATVTAMIETFGWDDGFSRRKLEDDFRKVVATRQLVEDIGAVRRRKRQLALTATGRSLLDDSAALWRRLCGTLVSPHTYDAAVQELALALMLQQGLPTRADAAATIAFVMDGERWRSSDGHAPDEDDVNWALAEFHWRLAATFLLEQDPHQPVWQNSWQLNQAGRAAAIEALRARATRPAMSPRDI